MTAAQPKDAALDRPIWAALSTTQAPLGLGDDRARRYHPDVAPFAALASEDPVSYAALHRLLQPGEHVLLKTNDAMGTVDGFRVDPIGPLHQMVLARPPSALPDDPAIGPLDAADADEMLRLVARTKPGPFGTRTREMGRYLGVRDQGRVIAMAGERMRFDAYVEISAVCVDPDFRGKRLARRLMLALMATIVQEGRTPFLHVLSNNASAIGLYETLGFAVRRSFHLASVSRQLDGQR